METKYRVSMKDPIEVCTYLALKNNEEPMQTNFPLLIMAILSPNKSASSIKCVDMMIVLLSLCFNINKFQIPLLE